jgi:pimeloyl-ACP methyl ester carboxylesterase
MALYVQETGTVGAQPILFLHPGLVSGWMWQEPAKEFADYHCLMPDLPGHGNSHQVEWISFQDTANQVAEVLKEQAPGKRAHVVGYSLGAYVTAQLLGTAPELVDRAIICGAAAHPLPGSALVTNRLLVRFTKSKFLWNGLASARLPAGLGGANCPTLIVAGQKEPKVVLQSIDDFLATLPNGQGYLAPEGDHYWGFKDPERFVRMVQAWITDEPLPQELIPVSKIA